MEKSAINCIAKAGVAVKPRPRLKPKKDDEKAEIAIKIVNYKHSLDLEKSDDNSLYVSALEDVTDSTKRTRRSTIKVLKRYIYVSQYIIIYTFDIFINFDIDLFLVTWRLEYFA